MTPLCSSSVLALAILLSNAPVEEASADAMTMAALQKLAISMEIMDPRETRYVFARPQDFQEDLKLVRQRYHELADAPPLCDEARFPERELINEVLTFNRAYRQNLEQQLVIERVWMQELNDAIQESEALYQIWDTVRDCKCGYYYVTIRRKALKKLRDKVGVHDYYNGCLPSPVPVWRFSRKD